MLMKVAVPCKDFADGHCPYGDYCSFIQYLQDDQKKVKAYDVCSEDKKPESIEAKSSMTEIEEGDERNEVQPQGAPSRSLKHRKSASTSNLSAWAKSLPKTDLLPFVKWDEEVLEKQKRRLSAFAPPFLQVPLVVDEKGELVSDSPETLQVEIAQEPESVSTSVEPPKASARSKGPPASLQPSLKIDRKDEQNQETMLSPRVMNTERPPVTVAVPKLTEPRKVSAWTKWPPISLKKVSIARNVHPDTPASVLHLAPPQSAFSLFGTESDPATPWYPAVRRQKSEDAAQAAAEFTNPEYSTTEFEVPPPFPSPSEFPPPLYAPSYPWGMPMLPMPMPGSGYESTLPVIPGGLGVIWTPAGWAVQDVAMKHSLRSAEVKAVYRDARRRTPKTYYRSELSLGQMACLMPFPSSAMQNVRRRQLPPWRDLYLVS
jgi:hypothetical protein